MPHSFLSNKLHPNYLQSVHSLNFLYQKEPEQKKILQYCSLLSKAYKYNNNMASNPQTNPLHLLLLQKQHLLQYLLLDWKYLISLHPVKWYSTLHNLHFLVHSNSYCTNQHSLSYLHPEAWYLKMLLLTEHPMDGQSKMPYETILLYL